MATSSSVVGTSRDFFIALLQALGITPTEGDLDALYSVEHLEGDNERYNPLNVIQPEPGSTAFNSVGVQSYPNFDEGVAGTAALLSNSHWAGVRAALKTGDESQVLAAFQKAYTWDPNVHFPTSATIDSEEASRMVGPGAPSAQLVAQITGTKVPIVPGAIPDIASAGSSAAGSAVGSVAGSIMVWVAKIGFVGIGGLLVVAGLYRASESGQNQSGGIVEAAKSGAALAAA